MSAAWGRFWGSGDRSHVARPWLLTVARRRREAFHARTDGRTEATAGERGCVGVRHGNAKAILKWTMVFFLCVSNVGPMFGICCIMVMPLLIMTPLLIMHWIQCLDRKSRQGLWP